MMRLAFAGFALAGAFAFAADAPKDPAAEKEALQSELKALSAKGLPADKAKSLLGRVRSAVLGRVSADERTAWEDALKKSPEAADPVLEAARLLSTLFSDVPGSDRLLADIAKDVRSAIQRASETPATPSPKPGSTPPTVPPPPSVDLPEPPEGTPPEGGEPKRRSIAVMPPSEEPPPDEEPEPPEPAKPPPPRSTTSPPQDFSKFYEGMKQDPNAASKPGDKKKKKPKKPKTPEKTNPTPAPTAIGSPQPTQPPKTAGNPPAIGTVPSAPNPIPPTPPPTPPPATLPAAKNPPPAAPTAPASPAPGTAPAAPDGWRDIPFDAGLSAFDKKKGDWKVENGVAVATNAGAENVPFSLTSKEKFGDVEMSLQVDFSGGGQANLRLHYQPKGTPPSSHVVKVRPTKGKTVTVVLRGSGSSVAATIDGAPATNVSAEGSPPAEGFIQIFVTVKNGAAKFSNLRVRPATAGSLALPPASAPPPTPPAATAPPAKAEPAPAPKAKTDPPADPPKAEPSPAPPPEGNSLTPPGPAPKEKQAPAPPADDGWKD